MFVAPCPHCSDSVTVPSRARPTSRVRCPLCTAEFTVDEMMAKLPPALELLDEPMGYGSLESEYTSRAGGEGSVATLTRPGTENGHGDIGLAEAEPKAERPSYEGGTATETEPAGKKLRTTARPKRKQKNMLLEGVKIVLGGLMAFPISMMILWAAGRDPFELAPMTVKYLPFMTAVIPAKLHSPVKKDKKNENEPVVKAPTTKKETKRPEGLPKLDNAEIPSLDIPKTDLIDPSKTLPDPVTPNVSDPADPLAPRIDPFDLDPEKKTKIEEKPLPDPMPLPDPTPEPKVEPVVKDAPQYTAAEVGEATKAAAVALQTWTEGSKDADASAKSKLFRGLYTAYGELGEKFAYGNPADKGLENHGPAVREALFNLQAETEVMGKLGVAGASWLKAKRPTEGILLLGTVKDVAAKGKLFETQVQLADKAMTMVTIVSPQDPGQAYKADDRVMVLGVIVTDTSKITGYEGDASQAVLSAMAVRVAAE
jgi:hypothetical protein